MIELKKYEGVSAVFGLGRSGCAVIEALLAAGNCVCVGDDDARLCADIAARYDVAAPVDFIANFGDVKRLILSPGVAPHHGVAVAARAAGVEIIGEFALFADAMRSRQSRIIAITGTNGKSTITALLAHCLEAAGYIVEMGGNIGTPVLSLNMPSETAMTHYVLEASSYQLALMGDFTPDIAILSNITPDHIDWHGDYAAYIAAKAQLFTRDATRAIIDIDTPPAHQIAADIGSDRLICVSAQDASADYRYDAGRLSYGKIGLSLSDAPALRGIHNAQNAALVFAAARVCGADAAQIGEAFISFEGLPHRLHKVGCYRHVDFVNDSKATNIAATRHALSAFDNIYWIAGGRAKGEDIGALRDDLCHVRAAYLIGESASFFYDALCLDLPCKKCLDMGDAVVRAADAAFAAGSGDGAAIVLLSPAAVSFDQYRDFEARGDDFVAAMRVWISRQASWVQGGVS